MVCSFFFYTNIIIYLILLLYFSSCDENYKSTQTNMYESISIGNQIWMAENLNVCTFRNGDTILIASNLNEWEKLCINKVPARYELTLSIDEYIDLFSIIDTTIIYNITSMKKINPKDSLKLVVYNDYAISDKRNIAPIGWKVPDKDNWQELLDFVGSESLNHNSKNNWSDSVFMNQIPSFSIYNQHLIINDSLSFYWTKNYNINNKFRNNNEFSLGIRLNPLYNILFNNNNETEVSYNHGVPVRCLKENLEDTLNHTITKSNCGDNIQIGNQIWASSDLNAYTFRNGDTIPLARDMKEWERMCKNRIPARYELLLSAEEYLNMFSEIDSTFLYQIASLNDWNINESVKLVIYNLYAVNDKRNIAPHGWSIPNEHDWKELTEYIGWTYPFVDDRLYKGWKSIFPIKPTIGISNNKIKKELYFISFWIKDSKNQVIQINPNPNYDKKMIINNISKQNISNNVGYSVRCIKNR